ncbi:MAG: hypothetical protein NZM04_10885 [Methylacidiphilales bacterium]|nr:hypothetical protein [Candidatus Methylacidiphilales bacterium]
MNLVSIIDYGILCKDKKYEELIKKISSDIETNVLMIKSIDQKEYQNACSLAFDYFYQLSKAYHIDGNNELSKKYWNEALRYADKRISGMTFMEYFELRNKISSSDEPASTGEISE